MFIVTSIVNPPGSQTHGYSPYFSGTYQWADDSTEDQGNWDFGNDQATIGWSKSSIEWGIRLRIAAQLYSDFTLVVDPKDIMLFGF